jgi:hypothetical protein
MWQGRRHRVVQLAKLVQPETAARDPRERWNAIHRVAVRGRRAS